MRRFNKSSKLLSISYLDKSYFTALSTGLIIIIILSCIKLSHIPEFVKDAQYYVQSALLWPSGKVSFAGNLIGERHLTVWYYHFFLKAFGYSLDSLSIALTILFALNSLCILAMSLLLFNHPLLVFIVSTTLNLISFCTSIWNFPATEATFTLANSFILLIWMNAVLNLIHIKRFLFFVCFCSLLAGFLSNFRPGNSLFIIGIFIAILFFNKQIFSRQVVSQNLLKTYRWISLISVITLLTFKLGSLCSIVSWRFWVPVDKPPTYFYAFIFFHPIHNYANGSNGLSSKNVLQEMNLNSNEKIDFWQTLGFTFTKHGMKSSDTIMRNLGLEVLKKHPLKVIRDTAISIKYYITEPSFEFKVLTYNYEKQWDNSRKVLKEYDRVRIDDSQRFGKDAHVDTASLAFYKLPLINLLREFIPSFKVNLKVPGVLFILMLLSIIVLLVKQKYYLFILFFPVLTFCFGTLIIAAFSQGFVSRYGEPFLVNAALIICVSFIAFCKEINFQ